MKYLSLLIIILAYGCVGEPEFPSDLTITTGKNGAYILCEGLMGMDNSTLSRYDEHTGKTINDYFAKQNNGLRLGDTGNDLIAFGEAVYIPVTKSRTIEKVRITDGVSLGRLILDKKEEPYRLAILNDTVGYFTLVSDYIQEFNPMTMQKRGDVIKVGPGPEGIAVNETTIFVANSGYGDLRQHEPKASTISVIDRTTKQETALLTNLVNVRSVHLAEQGLALYAMYSNVNTPIGLKGGLVRYDSRTLQETNRWLFRSPSSPEFNTKQDSIFITDSVGTWVIALQHSNTPQLLFTRNTTKEIWHNIKRHPQTGDLWIATYPEFSQNNGWVSVRSLNGTEKKRLDVLLTPRAILFF